MGWELGAGRDGLGLCEFHAPSVQGPLFLSLALREPSSLIVTVDGDRFIDESIVDNPFEAANALRRQPGQTAFGLIDAALREAILEKAARKASGPLYEDQMNSVDQFRRLLDGLAGKRGAVVGSIGEAAAAIGCDPEHLTGVIQRYNASCAAGYDQDFGKHHRNLRAFERPPFTVIRGTVGFFNTIGGLRVSSRLEAVDDRGRPIPGLYAAGVDVGGWQGSTYNFHLAGGSLGFAINSGRIAARHAVARLAG
jgi:fumarate reductase flavoprotein subunit